MAARKLTELFELLKEKPIRSIIVVCANDEHSIIAVSQAIEQNLVRGILIGDESVIESVCMFAGIDSSQFTVIHQPSEDLAALLTGVPDGLNVEISTPTPPLLFISCAISSSVLRIPP